jgi:predicted metal-dependent peptidase
MHASNFQKAMYQLLQNEPFYAHFILNSRIVFNHKDVPTAAATVIHGVPTFIFNEEFLAPLTIENTSGIIKHEVMHLVLNHLNDMANIDPEMKVVYNVALDCAINQYIDGLPPGMISLEVVQKLTKKPLLPFETSDYYYKNLKEEVDKIKEAGLDSMDEHGLEMEGQTKGELANGAIKRATQQAIKQSAGNVPNAVLQTMSDYGVVQHNWKTILKNFVLSRVSRETLNTQKRLNRRFKLPVPGKKQKRTMTLGVCVDSSGSVSDEQFISFLTEIKSISSNVSLTWLIDADSTVQHVEKLTSKSKLRKERHGCGGTAYQPAIDKARELKCDVIIYFGDGDTADMPKNPGVPFLWVLVGNQDAPGNFGKVLRLNG